MDTNFYMAQVYINNVRALQAYVNKLDTKVKYYDIDKIKSKILESIDKCEFQLKDIRLSVEYKSAFDAHKNVYNAIRTSLASFETLEQVVSIKPFINMLTLDSFETIRVYDMTRYADQYYYDNPSYTTFERTYLSDIYRSIKNRNGLNIFMPNCFAGATMQQFAQEKDKTYGNSQSYISEARSRMTRVIKGQLKGSHITNNFFDVLFLVPPVSYTVQVDPFGKMAEPSEKTTIKNCIKYCRQNGLIVLTMPATRIDTSLAFYLSKVLSDNTVIVKVPDSSLERVTIIGQKQITNKSKEELYNRLKYINYDTTPGSDSIVPTFSLPTEELKLDLFRGSTLDTEDILEAISNSNLVESYLNSQTQPLVVKDQSPLLPFNIGQVGLVLTSGCLDGIVEEIDGVYHVIKGMTTKLTTTQTEVSETDNKVKSTETISNQVKINVFTADGEFISLG